MRRKRLYYRRITTMLGSAAIIILLTFCLVVFLAVRNTRQNEKHLLSDAVSVQKNLFKGTMNYVRDTIGRLSTDENLIAWTEAEEDSPEYYYNALKTY